MKKRIFAVAAIICAIGAADASALECEVSTSVANERQTIKLTVGSDSPFENIAFRIIAPNGKITEETSAQDFADVLIAGGTLSSDADKIAVREVALSPDIAEGVYKIDVKSASGASKSVEQYLYSYNVISDTLSAIRTSADTAKLKESLVTYGKAVGIDTAKLELLEGAELDAAVELFAKNRTSDAVEIADLQAVLDEAVMIKRLCGGQAAVFEEYEPVLGLMQDSLYKKYEKETAAGLAGWYSRIGNAAKNAENIADIQDIAREQLLLNIIGGSSIWYTVRDIIKDNYVLLGFDSADIQNTADKVYQEINGRNYADKAALKTDYKKEKSSVSVTTPTGGGGTTSSAVSSGGKSSSPSGAYAVASDYTKPQPKAVFEDVLRESAWAAEAVGELYNKGIVSGRSENEFAPRDSITREEFTAMIVNMCGVKPSYSETVFADADSTKWYTPYITAAYEAGIVNGVDAENFGVGRLITRQDMAVITARAISAAAAPAADFSDRDEIAAYAQSSVDSLYSMGIVKGMENNCFAPLANATRAEAAQMIYMAMNYIEK